MMRLRFIATRALFLSLIMLSACSEAAKGPANVVELPEGLPDEEGRNTSILLTDSSWTKAILQVGRARKYNNTMETLIDSGLFVRFLDRDGTLNATLRADSARIDDKTGNMCAFGSVHVYSEKNRTIVDTDKLCYDKETAKLHSDSRVHVVDSARSRTIQGTGFESDESLKHYTIYNPSGQASGVR